MAVVVQLVVGQFEFVERHDLLGPLRSFGGRVGMDVDPRRRVGIGLAGHNPTGTATATATAKNMASYHLLIIDEIISPTR